MRTGKFTILFLKALKRKRRSVKSALVEMAGIEPASEKFDR